MKTYLVMGSFKFYKANNQEDAYYGWLEYQQFDVECNPTMFVYEAEPKDIKVDDMGCIHSPKGSKLNEYEIEVTPADKKNINKLGKRYELMTDTKWDVLDGTNFK